MNIKKPNQGDIPKLRLLWHEAFGDSDEFLDDFFRTAFSPERALAAYENKELRAALYWFVCQCFDRPIAYVYAVATAKASRGKGICHKLMAETHNILKDKGFGGVILVPAGKSLMDFYETMGYKLCTYVSWFECEALDMGINLRKLDKYEYETQRRKYLPYGGVIQENENADFLETQLCLYGGADFIMTAYIKDNVLYCSEILGNIKNAKGIVYALGCHRGEFRTAGDDIPFSMYISLDETTQSPQYFGHAFE